MADVSHPDPVAAFGAEMLAEVAANAIVSGFRALKKRALHETDIEQILDRVSRRLEDERVVPEYSHAAYEGLLADQELRDALSIRLSRPYLGGDRELVEVLLQHVGPTADLTADQFASRIVAEIEGALSDILTTAQMIDRAPFVAERDAHLARVLGAPGERQARRLRQITASSVEEVDAVAQTPERTCGCRPVCTWSAARSRRCLRRSRVTPPRC